MLDTSDERLDVVEGAKYGCLQVLDDGAEFLQVVQERISNIKEEKEEFLRGVKKVTKIEETEKQIIEPRDVYKPVDLAVCGNLFKLDSYDQSIKELLRKKEIKHYKCRCRKCGKIRYYSEETLQTEPKVCCKPVYCSSRFTYSIKANNANYNKRKKYENNEAVCLVNDKEDVIPADEYCSAWNDKREKELFKQAEKDAQIIAAIPRKNAINYYKDYTGLIYESLEVLECVNDKLESIPIPYYTQRHQKKYYDIIVYKEYRCRCYLCGKEKMVTCDKFGIFPPTGYGYRAYDGYWSAVSCECHKISSFQWIVNDILIKNGINYRVEVTVDGVYGIDNEQLL